jgi:hypothetical protein
MGCNLVEICTFWSEWYGFLNEIGLNREIWKVDWLKFALFDWKVLDFLTQKNKLRNMGCKFDWNLHFLAHHVIQNEQKFFSHFNSKTQNIQLGLIITSSTIKTHILLTCTCLSSFMGFYCQQKRHTLLFAIHKNFHSDKNAHYDFVQTNYRHFVYSGKNHILYFLLPCHRIQNTHPFESFTCFSQRFWFQLIPRSF